MRPPQNVKFGDDFQTPSIALSPLIPYLDPTWIIWECAEGKGNLTCGLERCGFKVIGTDILQDKDFLNWEPLEYDCIITNPPYSLKEDFLERCYQLLKPFALLLPLTALESKRRQKLYRKYGLELIIFNKRINFETPSGKGSGSWFATAWFTYNLNLPQTLNFCRLLPIEQTKLLEKEERGRVHVYPTTEKQKP